GGAVGVHRGDRRGALGGAAAGPGHREPAVRGGCRAVRGHRCRTGVPRPFPGRRPVGRGAGRAGRRRRRGDGRSGPVPGRRGPGPAAEPGQPPAHRLRVSHWTVRVAVSWAITAPLLSRIVTVYT